MKTKTKARRFASAIDAGSMADIAFLLLIFFLVVTVIQEEKGMLVQLPPYDTEMPPTDQMHDRNVLSVRINATDELMVEGAATRPEELRNLAKEFILNPSRRPDLALNPRRAVISLQNDRGTSYRAYLSVYNELKAAYRELWEEQSRRLFGLPYEGLKADRQREIRRNIPLVISEAEPSRHGKE